MANHDDDDDDELLVSVLVSSVELLLGVIGTHGRKLNPIALVSHSTRSLAMGSGLSVNNCCVEVIVEVVAIEFAVGVVVVVVVAVDFAVGVVEFVAVDIVVVLL